MKSISKQFWLYAVAFVIMLSLSGTSVFAGDGQSGDPSIQIVGGENADIKDYPWQVAIYGIDSEGNVTEQMCGGSIINPYWILTAAHCVTATSHKTQKIIAQISRLSQHSQGQIMEISDCIIHPNFNMETVTNDVALLRLSFPIDTSVLGAKAIRMLTPAEETAGLINPGVMATITGWGTTEFQGDSPDRLQVGTLPIISIDTANKWFKEVEPDFLNVVTEGMLPSGFAEGGVSGCHGDSGGPFVVKDETNTWTLAGITSWGNICGGAKQPAVYTRVPYYYNWIISNSKLGQEPSPTVPDYVDIVKIIVPEKVYLCGEVSNLGEALVRNNGTDFLESFEMTVKIGNSAEDIISLETKVIQLDLPLPSGGTKRIDLFGALPELYGNYYLEVSVDKPNGENVTLENDVVSTNFEYVEPNPLKLHLELGEIEEMQWVVRDKNGFSEVQSGSYNSSQSGETVNETICLPDGDYIFYFSNFDNVDWKLSFDIDDQEYIVFYKDESTFTNSVSFTIPFVPINDLEVKTFFDEIADSIFVCNIDQLAGDLNFEIANVGALPAADILYRITTNGIVEDFTMERSQFAGNSEYLNLNHENLVDGENNVRIEIISYNDNAEDATPENNVVEKQAYIIVTPKFAELEMRADENYWNYSWTIKDKNTGLVIMQQNVSESQPYNTDLCLAKGCYIFEPSDWYGGGISNDTAAILRKPNGEIIFVIKGDDFIDSKPVEFCNLGTGIKNEIKSDLNIYPNPAVDFVNLSLNSVRNSNATIEISDVLGNKLYSIHKQLNFGNNLIQLDVSALPNGVYLVRLISGNEISTKKITVGR